MAGAPVTCEEIRQKLEVFVVVFDLGLRLFLNERTAAMSLREAFCSTNSTALTGHNPFGLYVITLSFIQLIILSQLLSIICREN